jgi:hypothetical protein
VPLRICLCASGATGHLVYIKGPGGDGVGQIESKPGWQVLHPRLLS